MRHNLIHKSSVEPVTVICKLCNRPILSDVSSDEHHLIPKTFKGKETALIHKICHRAIHATFTERELAKYYHTFDRLLEHEKIQNFVNWVSKKDPEFYIKMDETSDRKNKRRR